MHILQLILFIRILDLKSSGKSVPEVVAGSGLERLSVMHQGFDGIGGFRSREFFLVCLAPLHHRDGQHLLTEIRVHIQHLDRSFLCLLRCGMGCVSLLP